MQLRTANRFGTVISLAAFLAGAVPLAVINVAVTSSHAQQAEQSTVDRLPFSKRLKLAKATPTRISASSARVQGVSIGIGGLLSPVRVRIWPR